MSLGDHLRYLRAVANVETHEVAAALGLDSPTPLTIAEMRYRPVEDDELLQKLAAFYNRPVDELHWHNARARKFLTFYLEKAIHEQEPIHLTLRGGAELHGQPEWWDLAAIGLRDASGRLLVVQRHAIIDWPQAEEQWWLEK